MYILGIMLGSKSAKNVEFCMNNMRNLLLVAHAVGWCRSLLLLQLKEGYRLNMIAGEIAA